MIRRGLQILSMVGITALGAAPCFGQVGTTNFPTQVTLQDFSDPLVNGLYVVVGGSSTSGTYVFQRYSPGGGTNAVRWLTIGDQTNSTQFMYRIWNRNPPSPHGDVTGLLYVSENYGTFTQSVGNFKVYAVGFPNASGLAVNSWYVPPPTLEEQLDAAFPDWESAAVKIPLGFGFAMAFWAVAVALSVSMKWVRDLASAAS